MSRIRGTIGLRGDSAGLIVNSTRTLMSYIKGLAGGVPQCVAKTDGAVLNGLDPLFDITGGMVRARIVGLVTTVLVGAANLRLQHTTITPAATVNLNAGAVAVDNDAAGTICYNVGATSVFTPSSGLGFQLR